MNKHDIELCEQFGVDVLGLVVEYPREVPWNLTREQAKPLIHFATHPTCIVTGGTTEGILSLAKELKPHMVQLHFRETVAQTAEIASELTRQGIQTIKAVAACPFEGESDIEALCETEIDAILVDSRTAENAATNMQTIDVHLFNRIKARSSKPLIIAGGITPDNISDIVSQTGATWIDVLTGVERSPGHKERKKIEALVTKGKTVQ